MNTLRDYVDWKLAHPQGYKSRNLFDKDNFVLRGSNATESFTPTNTGLSYKIKNNVTSTTYPSVVLEIGLASEFVGKTIILSSTSFYTVATKLSLRKGASQVLAGTDFTQSGNLYFSKITVEDKEYTDEFLSIMLYASPGTEAGTVITYDNIMVHEGTEPLPYEPYGKFIKK